MRIALIAALRKTDEGLLRAALELGGRSLAEWQAQLAIALGCERIICLCNSADETVLHLQSWVEAQGLAFHAIRGNLQLVGLIKAQDELLLLSDGLVADAKLAQTFAEDGLRKGIATIPSDHPLSQKFPDDFERIDRNRSWAGFALLGTGQVHKLADMPPDHDATSLLLRLALQSGEECRDLNLALSDVSNWQIAASASDLAEREEKLVKQVVAKPDWSGPGQAMASSFASFVGTRHIQTGPEIVLGTSAVLGILALTISGFGFQPTAISLGAAGCLVAQIGFAWRNMRSRLWGMELQDRFAKYISRAQDAVVCLILLAAVFSISQLPALLALPLLAIGLFQAAAEDARAKLAVFWADRALQMLIFATAAAIEFLPEALGLFAIGALLDLLLRKNST